MLADGLLMARVDPAPAVFGTMTYDGSSRVTKIAGGCGEFTSDTCPETWVPDKTNALVFFEPAVT